MAKKAAEVLSGGGKPKGKKVRHRKTEIEHHDNGSHTVRHYPADEKEGMASGQPVSYAAKDLDEVHDGLEEHLGEPNQEEAEAAPEPTQSQPPPTEQA